MLKALLTVFCALIVIMSTAQVDSLQHTTSPISPSSAFAKFQKDASYRAKRTAMKSALIPGWGQFVNKQYWKIPVIYLGVGFSAYFLATNYTAYQDYTQAYLYKVDDNPDTEVEKYRNFKANYLLSQRRLAREYLDYTVLAMVIGYAINIIDAAVFSHLDNFDVSPSISMASGNSFPGSSLSTGIKLNIHL